MPTEQRAGRSVDDVASELARQLIPLQPGSRLPTIRELARRTRASVSSVHEAIARLEQAGAIVVERRGRAGSFLASSSIGILWTSAAGGPLVVALPLARSSRYEALATAIKEQFTSAGLEAFLIFVRGSRQRLRALQEGRCHLAVMSAFAASELCGHGECTVLDLPPDTFNTGHRVFYSLLHHAGGLGRALVDRDSVDQEGITLLEFANTETELVPAQHDEFSHLLEGGKGDAVVWTLDEMQVRWPRGFIDRPLSEHVARRVGDTDRRAALVARTADADILSAIARLVDPVAFQQTQTEVLARRKVPEY